MRIPRLPATLAAAAVLAAACGTSATTSSSSTPTSGGGSATGGSAAVATGTTKLGTVLTTSSGRTLYILTADKPGHSTCTGACLQFWPAALLAAGAPLPHPAGVTARLGTIDRGNGQRQLTANGMPLYTYAQDSKSGDVNGQKINSFGGIWYVVAPNGDRITGASPAGMSSGGGGYSY